MRISKRDLILQTIIQEYVKFHLPIGSAQLQVRMNLNISPSTIRIYLKKLSQEGALDQLHVSSGRVPTQSALQEYWTKTIHPKNTLRIKSLDHIANGVQEFGLFCKVAKTHKDLLKEVMSVADRYLILVFDRSEIVLKYSDLVKRFLSNLIGCDILQLKKISAQVGLYELHDKIEQIFSLSHMLQSGESQVYALADQFGKMGMIEEILHPEFATSLQEGLYFKDFIPKGTMAVKHLAKLDEDAVSLFFFGRLESNFEEFLMHTCNEEVL
ncbi:MAG: HrcA family transcriptional regulator [Sulfurospirillum sp.]|nr:HrcA family transcriptional regulator [Sulfurospirillum sp.]